MILKSDREENELALDQIKKSGNSMKLSCRQCRKFYKMFAIQTKALDRELEVYQQNDGCQSEVSLCYDLYDYQ